MLEISQIRVPCGSGGQQIEQKIRKCLRLKGGDLFAWRITRHSVDARRKPELLDVYTVSVTLNPPEGNPDRERRLAERIGRRDVRFTEPAAWRIPGTEPGAEPLKNRPVVIGSGPAGLFCALVLAEAGYRPLIFERGRPMEERVRDVEHFFETGELDSESNVQFGEGGAGTFSDGKLTTGVKDRSGSIRFILETFVRAGAPEDILYENLPHIGTDRLREVIVRLRERILEHGGEIRFGSRVTEILSGDGAVRGVRVETRAGLGTEDAPREYTVPADAVVLAPGHSARDTMRALYASGVSMTSKNFAVGYRVSHPQSLINEAQYGVSDPSLMRRLGLPAASYKLTYQSRAGGRGVYSFCMCPGGYIVNASSEPGRLAVNGMSDCARDSARANSAIVMTVGKEDFGSEDVLAGMRFQEQLEERAYRMGDGRIPVERFCEFERARAEEDADSEAMPDGGACTRSEDLCGQRELSLAEREALCLKGRAVPAPLHRLLPRALCEAFSEGMRDFERKIPGFAGPDAFVCGLESRTSSPVRIVRDESLQSALRGLYPCGEGAGYAGGIMSAAADGIRIAGQIIRTRAAAP